MCVCLPWSNSGPSGGRDVGTGEIGGSNVSVRIVCVFAYEHCQEVCQDSGSVCPGGKEDWDVFVWR